MIDREYHERLNTHGMVLDRCADLEHSDSMIYTMKKSAWRCPVRMHGCNRLPSTCLPI